MRYEPAFYNEYVFKGLSLIILYGPNQLILNFYFFSFRTST
jgi:hypothetical protein